MVDLPSSLEECDDGRKTELAIALIALQLDQERDVVWRIVRNAMELNNFDNETATKQQRKDVLDFIYQTSFNLQQTKASQLKSKEDAIQYCHQQDHYSFTKEAVDAILTEVELTKYPRVRTFLESFYSVSYQDWNQQLIDLHTSQIPSFSPGNSGLITDDVDFLGNAVPVLWSENKESMFFTAYIGFLEIMLEKAASNEQ